MIRLSTENLSFVSKTSQTRITGLEFNAEDSSLAVGRAERNAASRAYVACELDSTVYVIDVANQSVVASIRAGQYATGVAIAPDGRHAYVSNGRDASVSIIDTASHRILATTPVGKRPWGLAVTPDGRSLYVANGRSNSVSVI